MGKEISPAAVVIVAILILVVLVAAGSLVLPASHPSGPDQPELGTESAPGPSAAEPGATPTPGTAPSPNPGAPSAAD